MSRGLGSAQRAVLDVVDASSEALAVQTIAERVHGRNPTAAQLESLRRAIRTLHARGLVEITTQFENRPRKSLKRFVSLAPCDAQFCDLCAQRKRRVRLESWHRKAMRANAKHDAGWLEDLALAEASGFVHETASAQRIIEEKPETFDMCTRRLQFVSPAKRSNAPVA